MGDKGKRWGGKSSVDIGSEEVSVEAPGWPWGSHHCRSWLSKACFSLSPVTRMEGTQRTAKEKLLYSREKDFLCLPK